MGNCAGIFSSCQGEEQKVVKVSKDEMRKALRDQPVDGAEYQGNYNSELGQESMYY